MKATLFTLLGVFLSVLITSPLAAAEMAGVTMEDSITIGDTTASLVGMGIRNKFVIKVYVAGLYMASPDPEPDAVIGSDQAKAVRMHFLYKKVAAGKLQEAWRTGFEKNTPGASGDLLTRMEEFISFFNEDAVKGDEYLFAYHPGSGTRIILKGHEVGTIEGADFASALMAIWFGNQPADKGLKKSVLRGIDGQ